MAIPDVPLFERFLSECELVPLRPEGKSIYFSESLARVGPGKTLPELFLRFPDVELKIESVLKAISKELEAAGSPASLDVALSVLALLSETRDVSMGAVAFSNTCLSSLHSVHLTQKILFPNPCRADYELQIGSIRLGAFDPEKVLYWARRGHSRFPIDLRNLKGRACLERAPFETRLINWLAIPSVLNRLSNKWGAEVGQNILDRYYQAIFRYHGDEIMDLVKRDLLVLESGALIHVSEDLLRAPLVEVIGLFSWERTEGRKTWALYHGPVLRMNFVPAEGLEEARKWLADELGFRGFSEDKQIHRSLESYCKFLQRAQEHRLAGNHAEAFLHFVIGLDLLLGDEGQSAESVAKRAAVLCHRQLEQPFPEQVSRIKRVYSRRSKYLHEGQLPERELLSEVEQICVEILWSLIASAANDRINSIADWRGQIDFIASALLVGMDVSEPFTLIGVPPIGSKRSPPNHVTLGSPPRFVSIDVWQHRSPGYGVA